MKHKRKDNFVFDPFFIVTALCCKTDRKVRILRPLGGGGSLPGKIKISDSVFVR